MKLDGVWAAFPISDVLATVVSALLLWWQLRIIRRMAAEEVMAPI